MMIDNPKDVEKDRILFASAVTFRDGAETILSHSGEYAGVAASLCHQSAQRMMIAFIQLKDNTVSLTAELTAAEIWSICTTLWDQLEDVDDEVQILLDCEWASYPPEPGKKKPDAEYAKNAIHCAQKLQQAILEAAPELAVRE